MKYSIAAAAILVSAMLGSGLAGADKPSWAGGGKHDKGEKGGGHESKNQGGSTTNYYFNDRQRQVVNVYYGEQTRGGKCPPGLAKKNNGCMPPGQAKKWQRGYPLPRDVVIYDVPQSLVVQLGVPPAGHKYVRVAADILLIAVGTSMVVDAIEDIGRM